MDIQPMQRLLLTGSMLMMLVIMFSGKEKHLELKLRLLPIHRYEILQAQLKFMLLRLPVQRMRLVKLIKLKEDSAILLMNSKCTHIQRAHNELQPS